MPITSFLAGAGATAAAAYSYFGDNESNTERLNRENNARDIPEEISTIRLLVIGSLGLGALYIAARFLR